MASLRTSPRHRGGLRRGKVKELARVGQWWDELEQPRWWRVKAIDAKKGLVTLERAGDGLRTVTFGELGSQYRLDEDEG